MKGGMDENWKSCKVKQHIDIHGGECLVTGRRRYCLDCDYRNPIPSQEASIDIEYRADSGFKFKF